MSLFSPEKQFKHGHYPLSPSEHCSDCDAHRCLWTIPKAKLVSPVELITITQGVINIVRQRSGIFNKQIKKKYYHWSLCELNANLATSVITKA